jgi:hypothetical protein
MKGKYLLKLFTHMMICCALVFALGTLPGCGGDDGDTGPAGPQGPAGPPGPPGEAAEGAEVTLEDLAALGLVYSSDVTAINPVLDLSKTVSYDAATGTLTIHFFLTDEEGNGIDVTREPYEMRLYVSELVPTIAGDTDNPGPAWNQLIAERGTPAMEGEEMPGTLTLRDAATGEYAYVVADTLAQTDHVIRVTMRARFRFRDNNNQYVVVANPVNASYDFLQSDPGTPLASSGADMVTTEACQSCHGTFFTAEPAIGHGGGYTQVKTCNHCHNVNYMATRDLQADLAFMIHRIHDAGVFAELGDFSEVTYPQHIYNCSKCHNGPEADLAYSNPTRSNCGSCHDNVDFATGANHAGGAQANDAGCALCHPAAAVQGYHNPAPNPKNVPEFDVTITMTPPANGQYYLAGEMPVVTVTLADHATGNPVAGTVYTTPQDGEISANLTEGLSTANLFVYGPRNEAVPVLTTNSTTDPALSGNPTQGHPLFVGGADPLVITDATGFKYQLMAIPESMAPGTYMVRFEGADIGATNDDYRTSSSAVINFQIGTATVEPKVSGDACINCHGDTIMHLEGAHPHHAPFDTDHCLACHDKSGNHGDYIGNRVHAVHRASITGDYLDRDWSEVTFPRPANNCTTCHTNPDAPTPVWREPSMLACGGCHGVMPNADPASYPASEQEQVRAEVAAAQHMAQNGGDAAADAMGAPPTLSCLVCHGEGRVADLFKTHHLIEFRPLPVDPNE